MRSSSPGSRSRIRRCLPGARAWAPSRRSRNNHTVISTVESAVPSSTVSSTTPGSPHMPSLSSRMVTALLILARVKHRRGNRSQVEQYVREHTVRPAPYTPPRRLDRKVAFSVDTRHGWTCYTVVPRNAPKPTQQVLYVHGGGFIREIIPMHWSLIAKIATKAPAEVTAPIYPLAPHSTACQTVPIATDIAGDLIARHGAHNVTLMGDSAGGNIILGISQTLRLRGLPQPRQLVLISPVLDVAKSNPAAASIDRYDHIGNVASSVAHGRLYAGELDSTDPLVSPLYADLTSLAPMVVFSGTHDIHNPEARDFAARARDAGIPLDYHEEPGGQHVYPLLPTAEGASARTLITALIDTPSDQRR
jgi:epsilon-lactone hydrolase